MKTPEYAVYLAKSGLHIRNPKTREIVPTSGEGIRVQRDNFWIRRELDGDVIRLDTQIKEPAQSKRSKSEG